MVDEAASPTERVVQERGPESRPLARYSDLGEIASGGMASVHFGRLKGHGGFAREVAIKRLHAHLSSDPEFVAMLLDEARLAGRIVHANVVPTLDVVVDESDVFVVMEYVRGLTLSQLCKIVQARGERIPLRIVSGIMAGVLHGLHAAHEATDDKGAHLEIVHRDVSPHNVLVGVDGIARLLDFGIAKAAVRLQSTQDGRVKGKIAYMSPEQVQGGRVTRRSDVYAAGVVLWEAVTGERLYQGSNEASIVLHVVNADVKPPSFVVPGVPPGVDEVVRKGTARSTKERYATAREMAADLDRAAPGASAAEIAEWVAKVGSEALQERAKRIAELEKAAADPDAASLLPPVSSGRPTIDATPLSKRTRVTTSRPRAELTTIAEIGTPSGITSPSDPTPPAAHVVSTPPPQRRRLLVAFSLTAIATAAAVIFGSGLYRTSRAPAAASSTSPSVTAIGVTSTSEEPAAPASAATDEAAPATATGPSSSASPRVRPPPPPAALSPTPPRHHSHSTPKCTPSTIDSAGHTHFNPACL